MSDPGSSVSERSPLLNEVEYVNHYLFVKKWDVTTFEKQRFKRDLVNVVSLVMRYGAPQLNLLSCDDKEDYTGYAVYADARRVWLVARIRKFVPMPFGQIVNAAIKNEESPFVWKQVPNPVKMKLTMFDEDIMNADVDPMKSINFERVLRTVMPDGDEFKDAELVNYQFIGMNDASIDDYFANDYEFDPWKAYNIIYYWSVCKRNEWRVSRYNYVKRKLVDVDTLKANKVIKI